MEEFRSLLKTSLLSQESNYFLQDIALLIPPPTTSSKTVFSVRDPEVRCNSLGQSWCSERLEPILNHFRGRIGLLTTTVCPKPPQGSVIVLEVEHGGWPIVELLADLCAMSSRSTFEIAEATDAKHLVNSAEAKFAALPSFSESMC